LQQSEENYRTIFDSANDAIFVMAADNGAIIDANHKVVELTGYSQEEAGRLTFADLSATTPPFTAAEVRLYFSRAMDGEPQLFEWQIIHSNDFRPIWVEINLKRTPIRGQERLLAVIRDIALRKEAELLLIRAKDEAEAANRLKTQFLANMSHEIRTPMNAVLGLTDIIMKKQVQPSDQRRYLQMIRDAGTTLLSLLNDILDYAKLEAGQFVLENQPFDLEQLVTDTVRCQARQAIGKGVELLCAPLPRLSALLAGDSLRLRQVLLNLLGNAIKFTAKGHILLEALVEEESDRELTIRISVSDTGIGIPADKQAVIFERFSQADPTLTRSYGGTGLGLAIARKVVELMGGRIWLESEEGKGSTFYCTFRFAKSTPFGDGRYPAGRPYQAMDALIIDNLPPRRRITAQLLGELGFTVEETDNEDDGLAALARRATDRRPPALVCLDLAPGAVDTALLELKLTAAAGGSNTSFLLLSPPLPMAPCEQHPWPDNFFCLEKPLSRTKLPALLIQAFPPAP
ncbi:MAG: ATP-binding protein, partial [Desulfobulbaceae bacterium]|nr:ATP-binding protein [Desulfobulbaceae bacterium]